MGLFGDTGASKGLERIVRRAAIVLKDDAVGQDDLLAHYAVSAADAINGIRHFTPTDDHPVEAKYESLAVEMVVYAFSKRGAEGQLSHSENGVSRSYGSAADFGTLTAKVTPVPATHGTE